MTRILTFVSRAEHLAWRARWKNGRWSILSPGDELRASILRQDEIHRQADARWVLRHGPIPGGATVIQFPQRPCLVPAMARNAGDAGGG